MCYFPDEGDYVDFYINKKGERTEWDGSTGPCMPPTIKDETDGKQYIGTWKNKDGLDAYENTTKERRIFLYEKAIRETLEKYKTGEYAESKSESNNKE